MVIMITADELEAITLWVGREFHEDVPVARGGPSTAENLTLFCRPHNLLQAMKDFGEEPVRRKQVERRAVSGLVALGYERGQAEQAVGAVVARLPGGSALEVVLKESLGILARRPGQAARGS